MIRYDEMTGNKTRLESGQNKAKYIAEIKRE